VRIPRTNNVYGQVIAPGGLRAVVVALEAALGPGTASMYRSRAGTDAEQLRIRTDAADFESLPLPGGMEHLLNGAVAGPTDDVARFVRTLSAALTEVKVEHTFEVHDGRRVVLSLP
jgi:hypothetical protein